MLTGASDYEQFYALDHPFNGVEIVSGIMDRFINEAQNRGKQGLIVLFPSQEDVKKFQETGRWVYTPLREAMDRKSIPYIDFGPYFAEAIGDDNPDDFYRNYHFNEESETLFAEYLYDHLRNEGFAK